VETEDTDCRVEVFNTASGKRLWSVCPRGNSIEDVFLQDGRVIVVAGSEVYCLSREGKSFWTRSLPSTPGHSVLIPGKALVVVMAGRMLGLSLEDGADLWQCEVSGELWQLTAGPDSVYVMTAMEEIVDLEERRRRYEKSAPMSGQQKMARKLAGIQDEEDAELKSSMIIRRVLSVLANYDVANGKQRWNRENIRGDVHPFDNGFMLLQYIYGLDAAMSGTIPTYVNMLSASNGRRRWKTKLDTYVRAAALTGDSVVLITETTIRALRRRGFINRLTRF
jgi:outer membrane protein assembly factor BamB